MRGIIGCGGPILPVLYSRCITILCCLVLAITVLYFHASYYFPFLSDDALISMRYAERFLQGAGLTWTDGKPVEGYSNLLWVLLLAFLGSLQVDLLIAVRLLSFGCTALLVVTLCYWYGYRKKQTSVLALMVGLLFLTLSAPIAVWSIGGLEQPLFCLLLLWGTLLSFELVKGKEYRRSVNLLGLVLGLLCITRPDGVLISSALFAAIIVSRLLHYRSLKKLYGLLPILLWMCAFIIGQLGFRILYYGEWLPNTAYVKFTPSEHHFEGGVRYLKDGLLGIMPLPLLALVAWLLCIVHAGTRYCAVILLFPLLSWSCYVMLIGGDIFPAFRHLTPIIVLCVLLSIEALNISFGENGKSKGVAVLLCIVLAPVFYIYWGNQVNQKRIEKAMSERWEWDIQVIATVLHDAFGDKQPTIAVTAAGAYPYWSKLPALDMLGLNDYFIARDRRDDIGKGYLGHELGSGEYVLSRKPDIIIFHTGLEKALFKSGREMQSTKEFYDRYKMISVEGKVPHYYKAELWFRYYSPKIGIRRDEDSLLVPGFYFLMGQKEPAFLSGQNMLVAQLKPNTPLRLSVSREKVPDAISHVLINGQTNTDIQVDMVDELNGNISIILLTNHNPVLLEEVRLVFKI